jgi:adenosylcobyric acid synthase
MPRLYIVGIGPGDLQHMTFEARKALEHAQVVVGYKTYLELIGPLIAGKEVVSSGMRQEVERCLEALRLAASGKNVALVSGGDAGVYGMAGLLLELADSGLGKIHGSAVQDVEITIIPGVSALQAAASVLGAPLMHDFAVISLSDLLTPWELIEKRLRAAATADFVTVIYNPRSRGRAMHLTRAREILLSARSPHTPVGIVRNACREGEEKVITCLKDMDAFPVDMFSIVIVGNSTSHLDKEGRIVTPRGYRTERIEEERKELPGDDADRNSSHAVMFCGTASDVGKSVLTAGLCRIIRRRGVAVAPFKSQNMALNSYVTPDGGEIGRAQAVQAEACQIPPHTDMNPVLLKPNSDTGSQVIVHGKVVGNMTVKEYNGFKPEAFKKVRESYDSLRSRFDFIVIEGAGSISEINLKEHDIANLKIAHMADCPVILVADIDRGGVFAQIVGTIELLEPDERRRVKGVIINKFRGDRSLLDPAVEFLENRTGVPVLGIVPWFREFRIPDEDSVALEKKARVGEGGAPSDRIRIGVVRLPRISNFTDFDSLESEPDVDLYYIQEAEAISGMDALILPGSKSTISDLNFLKEKGFARELKRFKGRIVGLCGGYQMLGRRVLDPFRQESRIQKSEGLGLLDVETVMLMNKETHQAEARLLPPAEDAVAECSETLLGYEIHMGETQLGPKASPFCEIISRSGRSVKICDGAVSPDGRVFGTYLHGIFDNEGFRNSFLNQLREKKGLRAPIAEGPKADPIDQLADHLESHLDMKTLLAICGLG